jgi:hypothetical protein
MVVATIVVFCATGSASAALSIKFDGPAGAGQTSPTSPAAGKISATGEYDNAGVGSFSLTCYYREKDTDPWTAMLTSLNPMMKTWSASVAGLPSKKTYKVKAVIRTATQMQETDVRSVTTQ